MNTYETIDAVYPPNPTTDKELRLITGKAPPLENDLLYDTDPTTEKGEGSTQRY